jgi:hypothetical protein
MDADKHADKVCRGKSDGNDGVHLTSLNTPRDTLAVSATCFSRQLTIYHHPPVEGCIRITVRQKGPDAYPLQINEANLGRPFDMYYHRGSAPPESCSRFHVSIVRPAGWHIGTVGGSIHRREF